MTGANFFGEKIMLTFALAKEDEDWDDESDWETEDDDYDDDQV